MRLKGLGKRYLDTLARFRGFKTPLTLTRTASVTNAIRHRWYPSHQGKIPCGVVLCKSRKCVGTYMQMLDDHIFCHSTDGRDQLSSNLNPTHLFASSSL